MKEKCIWIITLFFLSVPLHWLIQKFARDKNNRSSFDGTFVPARSTFPVYHEGIEIRKIQNEKKRTNQKSILLLNWEEFHEEKQKIVIQNQYKGDGGYGKEPFKSKHISFVSEFGFFAPNLELKCHLLVEFRT